MKDVRNANTNPFNRWEDIFGSVIEPIVILDPDQIIIEANRATLELIKKEKHEIIGKRCYEIFHDEDKNPEKCPFFDLVDFKENRSVEMMIESFGGYYQISCSPLFDEKGNLEFIVHIASNVTERKKNEELLKESVKEKEMLLREIHHRVKNNFQIISSLLNLQANNIKDQDLLNLFNNAIYRIRSMALIHEHLYQSNKFDFVDFKAYLTTLICELYENYKFDSKIEMDMKIDNIFLDNDDAMHCGLIVNEILTNSFKYAFPSDFKGSPLIKVYFENTTGNFLELKISDNGIGMPDYFDITRSKTLGMSLINSLIKQINGIMELEKENGTGYLIKFKKRC
jgi:PAS domain S-box-containing protein